jgi:hypothetical protein
MKLLIILCCVISVLYGQESATPGGTTVTVRGTSNLYLAGMPDGTKGRFNDKAPGQWPVLVNLSLTGAQAVTFTASGGVAHDPGLSTAPPDGSNVLAYHKGSEHGVAGVTAPFESLMGVFLTNQQPDRGRAPRPLKFSEGDTDFTTFSPQLKQVFFIGSGVTKSGVVRKFLIPSGATRLFLGTMDEFDWCDNIGSFSVTVNLEGVTSDMYSVDSNISFADWPCLPGHRQCTPERPIVEARGPHLYHLLLPAQLEWGVSIPNPDGLNPAIQAAHGTVCLDQTAETCSGPEGKGGPGGAAYLMRSLPPGALIVRTTNGRAWFSVNGRSGPSFQNHDGFFEFDVSMR